MKILFLYALFASLSLSISIHLNSFSILAEHKTAAIDSTVSLDLSMPLNTSATSQSSQELFGFKQQGTFSLLASCILIITGFVLFFFGFHFIQLMIFIFGFYIAALAALMLLNTFQANGTTDFTHNRDLIYFFVVGLAGLVGGILLLWIEKIAFFLTGACLGFLAGCGLLQIEAISNPLSSTVRIVIIVIFAAVGAILVYFSEKPILVIASSGVGSIALFTGIDYWIQSGLSLWIYRAVGGSSFEGLKTPDGYYMIAGVFLLAGLGIARQWHLTRGEKR